MGGAQANQPAEISRPSDGTARVFTQGRGTQGSSGGRAGTAAGGAGVFTEIPRVSGSAIGVVVNLRHGEFAHIKLAEQHCTRLFQVGDNRSIIGGDVVLEDA